MEVKEKVNSARIRQVAAGCGFQLAGVAPAGPVEDWAVFRAWLDRGHAASMSYLTDHRADLRRDVRSLLPSARSVISVAKLYSRPEPLSSRSEPTDRGWISRYAWGDDYHEIMRAGLTRFAEALQAEFGQFEWKACVDTAPVLERSFARSAGLGWIGKNTCLINQEIGSWIFLGELLVSLEIEPDRPAPDRCGTCSRCIQACPTEAIVPSGNGWTLDSGRCISYFTIELRGAVPTGFRAGIGRHVFGCDICQDVCPWNSRAPEDADASFEPREYAPPLEELAALTEEGFRERFRGSPVRRAKYAGFLRNVAIAMGNTGNPEFREPLRRLAESKWPEVAEHARWALRQLDIGT